MDERDKKAVKIIGALAALGVLSYVSPDALKPSQQAYVPAEPQHGCSGYMDDYLTGKPNEDELRRKLCDEGGEKALTDMIEARENERRKPAF